MKAKLGINYMICLVRHKDEFNIDNINDYQFIEYRSKWNRETMSWEAHYVSSVKNMALRIRFRSLKEMKAAVTSIMFAGKVHLVEEKVTYIEHELDM